MSNGLHRVCAMCKHCNEKNECGLDDCSSNFFQHFKAKKRTDKTLLDEFAMAAMQGICANVPLEKFAQDVLDNTYGNDEQNSAYAYVAYDYAAAMMAERARRDEMGNVKEVDEA